MIPLRPLSPILHPRYVPILMPESGTDPLPADVRTEVNDLLRRRNEAREEELDAIERATVARTWWYALRPDEIASDTIRAQGLPTHGPMSIAQATLILAALGEAGYDIAGNGAPEWPRDWDRATAWDELPPVRGPERERVIWEAAAYWAKTASRHLTYVSLGDCRGGYMPRAVQYDQPGSMNPSQQAALTFGPWADRGDECGSHAYMRRHTRRLILVREES